MSLLTEYHFDLLYIAGLLYVGLTASAFVTALCVILLHFLMPQAVLDRYWKEPYFRAGELALFTDTLYAPMRTIMLMGAIAFPRLGRKRKITDVRMLVPGWYRSAAKVISIWIVVGAASIFVLTIGVFVHGYLTGNPVPLTRRR